MDDLPLQKWILVQFKCLPTGLYRILGYHNSSFPFSIIREFAIPNRPIALVHNMTNSQCSLMVSAEWLRSKDGRYFTARSTASIAI